MFRGAVFHSPAHDEGRVKASVVAIVFAAIAAVSFAVDVTISLSGSAPKAAVTQSRPIVR